MILKLRNIISFLLIFIIISNFFHIYNWFIFPIKNLKYVPNLNVEMNLYFFIISFFLFIFIKKKIFIVDKTLIYFILIFIYALIIEFSYSKNFNFIDTTNPHSTMFINFINMIIGYYLCVYIIKYIEIEKIKLAIILSFGLFCALFIFYIFAVKIFIFIFIDGNDNFLYSQLLKTNLFDLLWDFSNLLREKKTFISNSILHVFSLVFVLNFKLTKSNLIKIFYLIIFLILFISYNSISDSRSSILILSLVMTYFFLDFLGKYYTRKFLILLLGCIISLSAIFVFPKILNQYHIYKLVNDNTHQILVDEFDEDSYKKAYPGLQSYGEIESSYVRIATTTMLVKAFFSETKNIIFGMSSTKASQTQIGGFSSHSLLINFIVSYGAIISLLSLILFLKSIGIKKFKKTSTYFFLIFLIMVMLFHDKYYSYYSIIIYFLVNKNITLKKLYEKN